MVVEEEDELDETGILCSCGMVGAVEALMGVVFLIGGRGGARAVVP